MASPATHLAKIDEAIDAILTAMADTTEQQSIKIRGREVQRKDWPAQLRALTEARKEIAPLAARESSPAHRPVRYGIPSY